MDCDILSCKKQAVFRLKFLNGDVMELCGVHTENKIKEINSIEIEEMS